MIKLRGSNKKGWLMKFTNWESWEGADDGFELAIKECEMKAMYLLLRKHYSIEKLSLCKSCNCMTKTGSNGHDKKYCLKCLSEKC